ncbi:dTMP kinase [Lachnospiraceae bacterium ZAX-1]
MQKNTYDGILVAIDGPNGVGKSTLITNLEECLKSKGINVYTTKEPSTSALGNFTRQIAETIGNESLACLVAADRYEHLRNEVVPKLQDGCIVIMDRYVLSSLILQRMDGVETPFVLDVNQNILLPDLQFAIIADIDVIQERLGERATLTRFEKDNQTNQELCYLTSGIEELRKLGIPVITIENSHSLNENVQNMMNQILLYKKEGNV